MCKSTNEKIPYFNAPVYLNDKNQIGKVEEIFGATNDVVRFGANHPRHLLTPLSPQHFTVKLQEGFVATSFKKGDSFYVSTEKLLPLARFLPQPKSAKGPSHTLFVPFSDHMSSCFSSSNAIAIILVNIACDFVLFSSLFLLAFPSQLASLLVAAVRAAVSAAVAAAVAALAAAVAASAAVVAALAATAAASVADAAAVRPVAAAGSVAVVAAAGSGEAVAAVRILGILRGKGKGKMGQYVSYDCHS
mgnify:CR=1 FL=1